jgi:hypothetical protein
LQNRYWCGQTVKNNIDKALAVNTTAVGAVKTVIGAVSPESHLSNHHSIFLKARLKDD